MARDRSKIVVTGKDGQVAQALARHLPSLGLEVVTLARPAFDLASPASLIDEIRRLRPASIVNAAAYTAVDKAEDEPELAFAVNEAGAAALAATAEELGVLLVHLSTDYVFDGSKVTPYVETDPVAPLGVYGASKLAGERAITAAGARHVILRTAWVCSPDGHNFVKTMLRVGASQPKLRVVDDQRGAPTFADDIAAAIGVIVRAEISGKVSENRQGVFHLASGGQTTWCGFARAIMAGARARGKSPMAEVDAITTAEYPTKARRPAYSKLDASKLARVWGIELPEWQVGLDRCLDQIIGPRCRS